MSMRITTGMTMNTYRFNLQKSTGTLASARDKVLTQRQFNSYFEDPAAATQAWRIRRSMRQNNDYLNNTSDTYSRFSVAYSALDAALNEQGLKGVYADIRARTDSTASGRQPLGQELSELAETIIQTMNGAKYSDHFVFAGDDAMNPPFSWSDDMQTLYYRGVNVNAGEVERPAPAQPVWFESAKSFAGEDWTDDDQAWLDYFMHVDGADKPDGNEPKWFSENANKAQGGSIEEQWVQYYRHEVDAGGNEAQRPTLNPPDWGKPDPNHYNMPENMPKTKEEIEALSESDKMWYAYYVDQGDVEKLKAMSDEHTYVDLGMGLREDEDGNLINGTAFDTSLPGINVLGGFGLDEDGDPENIAMILKRLGAIYSACDPDTGAFASKEDEAAADRLLDKLHDKVGDVSSQHTEITTKAAFLLDNQTRLEDQADTLQEERYNVEMLDPAEAIMDFMWDYSCFSAALKIGNQLLGQSLIDYMN